MSDGDQDSTEPEPKPLPQDKWPPVVIAVLVGAVLGGVGAWLLFGSGGDQAAESLPDTELFETAGQADAELPPFFAGPGFESSGGGQAGVGQVVEGRVARVIPAGEDSSDGEVPGAPGSEQGGGDPEGGGPADGSEEGSTEEENDQEEEEEEDEQEAEEEEKEEGGGDPEVSGFESAVGGQGVGVDSPGVDPALPGAGGLAGSGGCHQQCIVKALAIPNITSPNLQLDVRTTVPATIAVYLDEDKNQIGEPIARVDDPVEQWSPTLEPLEWDTMYHIRVRAEDQNGGVAWRVGKVRTPQAPANQPGGGLANVGGGAGCSVPCITQALLVPLENSPDMELRVKTNTPAMLGSWVFDKDQETPLTSDPPYSTGGEPVTEWTTRLDLNYSTSYRVWVRAIDGDQKGSELAAGDFTTETPTLIVDFHRIAVHTDGDDGVRGPGEIEFRMAVGDLTERKAWVKESKISDGETIHLEDGNRSPGISVFEPAGAFVPVIRVQAWERDGGTSGTFTACNPTGGGALLFANSGIRDFDECDIWINTAQTDNIIASVPLDPDGMYEPCPALGLTGDYQASRCRWITTTDNRSGYPTFSALISLHVLE